MKRVWVVVVVVAIACSRGTESPRVQWLSDEAAAFEQARREGKAVMIEFWASWCEPCDELEQTLTGRQVYPAIRASFIPLKLDVTESTEQSLDLKSRYRVETLPSVVFVAADGEVLARITKTVEPDRALAIITDAAAMLTSAK